MHAAAQGTPVSRLFARIRVRPVRLAGVALAAAFLALPAVAFGSDPGAPGTHDVQPLWQGYPLDPGSGAIDRTAVPKRTAPARPTPAVADGGGSSGAMPLAVAGGSMLLLAALATLVVIQRRRTVVAGPVMKGAPMSRFINRRSKDDLLEDASAEAAATPTVAEDASAQAVATPTVAEDDAVQEPETAPAAAGNVGEHVQSVLRAAEDASARLIQEAQAHAKEVREAAEREAASRLETARADAERLTAETERAHIEATAAAAEVRAAAEADAARRRAAADEAAAEVRAWAERDAVAYAEEAAGRYDGLLEDTAFAEDRLRRLVAGLRDVADRLDHLLGPGEDDDFAEPADREYADPDGQSLDETLDPGATRAGATSP
jgi:hypothetical protein